MMKYRQVLSGAVLAGALALPAAELVRVDFSREDAAQPPRSTGYVPGEVIDLPTGLPEQGAQIVSGALELAFPASSSDAVSAWFGAWNLESSGRGGISFDLTVAAYRAPSDGRPETVLSAQLLGDQGRNIGMLTFVSEGPEKGIIQWNPASGAPERFGAYRVGETYSFQINYDPASGAAEVTRQGGKTVRSAGAGALPFRQFRIGSGWAVGGRDGAATVRVGKVAVRDAAKGGKAALPKVTAGPKTPPGIGEWDGRTLQAELKGPYEDRLQQQIPFGCTSYYLTPWRAYMDTHPASRFGRIQAVNWSDLSAPESEATMRLLAEAGFRSFRLEIGWGHFDFDDESQLSAREVERLKLVLPLAKKYKLRPMILLNAHSGGPCPRRTVPVELAAAAPAGARELRLKGGFAPFRTGRTGLNNQEQGVAFPLITGLVPQPDGTVLAQLSAPLNRAVPAGKAELTELKYAPFSGDVLEDGTPNPEARETVDGWCRYVKHVTCAVRDILDSGDPEDAGFDVEVWNEYSFGSQFVWERNYYRPARKFRSYPAYAIAGKTTADAEVQAEIVLPLTIELVNDPAMRLPGVRVVSGFSNQRPWDNGSEMWPGQAGFSRHYYTNLDCSGTWHDSTGYLSAATENSDRLRRPPLDAQGKTGKGFVPELRFPLPESPCFGIKTEFMIRDMQPFPGPWAHHHRFSHPGTGKPALLWETEFNTYRRPFAEFLEKAYGVKRGDPRLQPVLQAVAAKALVRSFVFYCHKGIDTLFVFAVRNGEDEFSILPEAYFRALARNRYQLNDEVRRAADRGRLQPEPSAGRRGTAGEHPPPDRAETGRTPPPPGVPGRRHRRRAGPLPPRRFRLPAVPARRIELCGRILRGDPRPAARLESAARPARSAPLRNAGTAVRPDARQPERHWREAGNLRPDPRPHFPGPTAGRLRRRADRAAADRGLSALPDRARKGGRAAGGGAGTEAHRSRLRGIRLYAERLRAGRDQLGGIPGTPRRRFRDGIGRGRAAADGGAERIPAGIRRADCAPRREAGRRLAAVGPRCGRSIGVPPDRRQYRQTGTDRVPARLRPGGPPDRRGKAGRLVGAGRGGIPARRRPAVPGARGSGGDRRAAAGDRPFRPPERRDGRIRRHSGLAGGVRSGSDHAPRPEKSRIQLPDPAGQQRQLDRGSSRKERPQNHGSIVENRHAE